MRTSKKRPVARKAAVVQPDDTTIPVGNVLLIGVQSNGTVSVVFPTISSGGPGTPPLELDVAPTTTVAALMAIVGNPPV